MGEYVVRDDSNGHRHSREHQRIRWYSTAVANGDREALAHHVVNGVNEKWVFEEGSEFRNPDGIPGVNLLVKYGPVHGNFPSDVARIFRVAGVKPLVNPDPTGDVIHVPEGCRHYMCCDSCPGS